MNSNKILAIALLVFHLLASGSLLWAGEKTISDVDLSIPFEISPTGHQIVTLMYGKEPIRMILDTAAGTNVFSQKAAKKLELTVKESGDKAAGLGTQGHAMANVSPITVASGNEKMMLQNLVSMDLSHVEVAGGSKGIDGLLGSPFFREYKAKIDFEMNRVTLRINRKQVEQAGAGQPATAPESKPWSKENPKPESEVAPR
jgi:hypothetical protein